MSQLSWQIQHTVGHHVHTNVAGADPDLYHFSMGADRGVPGFRTSLEMRTLPERTLSGKGRRDWWRRGLVLRAPLATIGPGVFWDILMLANPAFGYAFLGMVPYRHVSMWRLSVHSIGRSVVIWLAIIHPITICLMTTRHWILGIMRAVLFTVLPYATHGCLFYLFSQVSHIQHQCFAYEVDGPRREMFKHAHEFDKNTLMLKEAKGEVDIDSRRSFAQVGQEAVPAQEWAVHQVEHALDYAVSSTFWLHFSVGLNLQVVHHLFPQVAWCHYKALCPIIAEVSQKFGVRHNTVPTFSDAVRSHFTHLVSVNETHGLLWARPPPRNIAPLALDWLDQVDYAYSQRPGSKLATT